MKLSDKDKADHVRSAKTWLEKAERSFDTQSCIKGELNLMLAEAEMKNLRKNHAVGQRLISIASVLTAVVLAGGIWCFTEFHRQTEPITPITAANNSNVNSQWTETPTFIYAKTTASDSNTKASVQTAEPQTELQPGPVTKDAVQPEQIHTEETGQASQQDSIQVSGAARTTVMTDRQVQKAVQDAQHSLRGK